MTGFDITKAKAELNYQPHSFTDGLAVLANQIQSLSAKNNSNVLNQNQEFIFNLRLR
jgi:hypothetical protein